MERMYWSNEVATILGIGDSSLRKWCLALEKCGIIFIRDDNGRRAFSENDILVLRDMQMFLGRQMTMDNAANATAGKHKRDFEDRSSTLPVPVKEQRSDMRSLDVAIQEASQKFWNEIRDDLKKEIRQEMREEMSDQLEQLKKEMFEQMQETRRQIAIADEKKKKRFFGLF